MPRPIFPAPLRRRGVAALALATALGTALAPVAPSAAPVANPFRKAPDVLARAGAVMALRSMIDLSYDTLTVDPDGGGVSVSGLILYPLLDADFDGLCQVHARRATLRAVAEDQELLLAVSLRDVSIHPACLEAQPLLAPVLNAFGTGDGLGVETVTARLRYSLPDAGATLDARAAIAGGPALDLRAGFDYLGLSGAAGWLARAGLGAGDPADRPEDAAEPGLSLVAQLSDAVLSLEDRGTLARIGSRIPGGTAALPDLAAEAVSGYLATPDDSPAEDSEAALTDSLRVALGDFLRDPGRLTLRMSADPGVWLDGWLMADPALAVSILSPRFDTGPLDPVEDARGVATDAFGTGTAESLPPPEGIPALAAPADPALVAKALKDPSALDPRDRLAAGMALVTGTGVPRELAAGAALLAPLAKAGDAGAALALARAMATRGDALHAYPWALAAMAGGVDAGGPLADRLETVLSAGQVVETQADAVETWAADPGLRALRQRLFDSRDPGAMARTAEALRLGDGLPRSYARAYFWATLAATAGNGDAVALRDMLDRTARGADPAFRDALDAAAAEALALWIRGRETEALPPDGETR